MSDASGSPADLRIVHVFDAPRELVFAAFIDPDQIGLWWAPPGFVIPRDSIEIQPYVGGRFVFTLEAADGSAGFPYPGEIASIVAPELLVIRVDPIPGTGIAATVTRVAFEADGDRTRMMLTSGPYTGDVRADAHAGWTAAVAALARLLSTGGRRS